MTLNEHETDSADTEVDLGKTSIRIKPLGVGAWSWGDRFYWGYGRKGYGLEDIREAFNTAIEAGLTFFDTAEIYGRGNSEKFLGSFIQESNTREKAIVATKFFPYPWRFIKSSLQNALKNSLDRLGLSSVHLYQIHWPYAPRNIETWVSALAGVAKSGLTQAVGVSNYNLAQMEKARQVLEAEGLSLTSNQVEYSLIARSAERSGLLAACQQAGISLIAYSPIGSGVLTGKYTPENRPTGPRGRRFTREYLENIQPLLAQLIEIGNLHNGKTPAQVALNWVIAKGAIPIPGAKNRAQASENIGALGWRLDPDEIAELDKTSAALIPPK